MIIPFPFESKRRNPASDFALVRATTITITVAVAGTAVFSMLIALSHAIQGKDLSLSRTLLRAAPACALLAILGIPAIALARRAVPDRIGAWRAMLAHAALALLFAGAFTVLRALVDLVIVTPASLDFDDGVRSHFVRGFGVAGLVYWSIVMGTWMFDRHRQPSFPPVAQLDVAAEPNLHSDSKRPNEPATFVVRTGLRTYVVPLDRVDWIEAQGNYVALHADGRSHLVRHTMKSLSACLDQTFVRVERSAMVRVSAIREVRSSGGSHLVVLRDGSALKISRRMREAVISAMATTG